MYLNVSTRPGARARQIRVLCLTHLSDKADVGLSESPQKSTGPSPRTPPGAALLLSPVGSAEPCGPRSSPLYSGSGEAASSVLQGGWTLNTGLVQGPKARERAPTP